MIRARALEAAREEIKELREANEAVKGDLERVVEGRKQLEEQFKVEKTKLNEQCSALELTLEKQKIFVNAHKRDMESAQQDLLKARKDCDEKIAEIEKRT